MSRIISLLYILSLAAAIDPWEKSFIKKDKLNDEDPTVINPEVVSIITEHKQPDITQWETKGGIGDNFYKRLLGVIVSRGQFKETTDGIVEGSLHFEFPLSKFKLLEEMLSKTEVFTPKDYRTVDGLMMDCLHKVSFVRQVAESWTAIILTWWNRYIIHIIICLGTCACIYAIYKATSVKHLTLTIVFLFFWTWEFMLAKEEADLKDYQEFAKQQQCSWIYFFSDCSSSEIVNKVSRHWDLLHPAKILGNLLTRIVMCITQLVFSPLNKFLEHISERAPLGTQGIVYTVLSFFTVVLFIFIGFALIFNVILNRPFSLSFLFLNFNLKQKTRSTYSDDSHNSNNTNPNGFRQPIGDSLSGGNLNILMNTLGSSIVSSNQQLPTNHNSGQLQIRYNPKKNKSSYVRSGKSSSKVSIVPSVNKMHGRGDHL